jgi:hypothetical protein
MNIQNLPPAFQALEARLVELQARHSRGELDTNLYQAEVQNLKVEDHSGRNWWLGGERGAWHYWDGSAWLRANPPSLTHPDSGVASRKEKRSRRPFVLGCGTGTLIVVVLTAIVLIAGWQAYLQEPRVVEGIEAEALALAQYPPSTDQMSVIDHLGNPEAFAILFYEEEQGDGSMLDIRFETWSYFTADLEYTFINGEMVAEDALEITFEGGLVTLPYRPEQFMAYMSLDELIASSDLKTYLVVPLEKELVEGGEVYYADGLTFGLKDDELLYVEALALEVGE